MNKLLDRLLEIQGNNTKIYEQLKVLERQKQQAQTSIDNLFILDAQSVNGPLLTKKINEYQQQVETLEIEISKEKSKIDTTLKREQLEKYYNEALKRNGKEIVGLLIKIIRVYNDKIEITFNSPIKKSPDDNQGSFYDATCQNPFSPNKSREHQTIKTEYYV